MSAHHCQNAFFKIWLDHNPFGIMLATSSDMMHLYESGILKCMSILHGQMSMSMRVDVDNLMEDMF
jgi:hypothetical protein